MRPPTPDKTAGAAIPSNQVLAAPAILCVPLSTPLDHQDFEAAPAPPRHPEHQRTNTVTSRFLKPASLILPVITLVVAGAWIGSQRRSIATLEQESSLLQKQLCAARSADESARPKPNTSRKSTQEMEPIRWQNIAGKITALQRGGDMPDLTRFQQQLASLSRTELVAALDEIAALDLPPESRAILEGMLIGPLIEQDPELALTRFIGRLHDERSPLGGQLSAALTKWAEKDPEQATAWFDRQIAAGTFDSRTLDGRARSRTQFEGALIAVLLSSSPDSAARRLDALPEDQRAEVLKHHLPGSIKQEDLLAFANLARRELPESEQIQSIAGQVSRWASNDDYSAVTGYLDRINASPAERVACVERAAESRFQSLSTERKITRQDIDQLRAWTDAQSPESTDRATGKALTSALQGGGKTEFSEIAGLAIQYHDAGGSDELLIPLFRNWRTLSHKEQARALAEGIADEKRRTQILEKLK